MIWVVGHPDLLAEVLAGFPALWFLAEPLTLSIAPVGEEGLFAVETNSFMVLVGHVASRQPRTNDEKRPHRPAVIPSHQPDGFIPGTVMINSTFLSSGSASGQTSTFLLTIR